MSKSSTDHNNDGQGDGSNDKFDPPHSVVDEAKALVGVYHKTFEEVHDYNRAYGAGNKNGRQ